jgi:hypothetical protein
LKSKFLNVWDDPELGTLVGTTDFHSDDIGYFGSWAVGHGEIQRFADSVSINGNLYGQGNVTSSYNVFGAQDWNWAHMTGNDQYDTSYLCVGFPTSDTLGPSNYGFWKGDLYLFSYAGSASNLWLNEGCGTGGSVSIDGSYTPHWSISSTTVWSGVFDSQYQVWVRFTDQFLTANDGLIVFQQTPAGNYGSNFSIDSIVMTPIFSEPSYYTS